MKCVGINDMKDLGLSKDDLKSMKWDVGRGYILWNGQDLYIDYDTTCADDFPANYPYEELAEAGVSVAMFGTEDTNPFVSGELFSQSDIANYYLSSTTLWLMEKEWESGATAKEIVNKIGAQYFILADLGFFGTIGLRISKKYIPRYYQALKYVRQRYKYAVITKYGHSDRSGTYFVGKKGGWCYRTCGVVIVKKVDDNDNPLPKELIKNRWELVKTVLADYTNWENGVIYEYEISQFNTERGETETVLKAGGFYSKERLVEHLLGELD